MAAGFAGRDGDGRAKYSTDGNYHNSLIAHGMTAACQRYHLITAVVCVSSWAAQSLGILRIL